MDVFIVLSGFCLMLPIAASPNGELRGGLRGFVARRARRILPPYYAALFGTWLLLLLSSEGWALVRGRPVSQEFGAYFGCGNALSHLLLIHNWDSQWNMSINFPLWSVATEWQIYFVFGLLLLPVFRWAGGIATVVLALALGVTPRLLLPVGQNFDWAGPWLVALFALGMIGAKIAVEPGGEVHPWRRRFPWGLLAAGSFGVIILLDCLLDRSIYELGWSRVGKDLLVGFFAVCLILHLAFCNREGKKPLLLQFLESPAALFLGAISYSLYLTHVPAMFKVFPVMNGLHLGPAGGVAFRIVVAVPWMIAFAYVFYRLFERPFVTRASAVRSGQSNS